MAAVAQLLFLLFALINNICGEELIRIRHERDSYTFWPSKKADYCLISRSVGEEKLVLWNTSALREAENSTVPEDLKTRLSVVNRGKVSYYRIQDLTPSDSGLYQEQCWGNVTHETNISIIVCTTKNKIKLINVRPGETVDVPCDGAADDQDVQWLRKDFGLWSRVSVDSERSVMDNDEERPQEVKTSLRLHYHNLKPFKNRYVCLVMNHQQCVSSQIVSLYQQPEIIHHSVGETAVLQCPENDLADDQTPVWRKYRMTDKLIITSLSGTEQLDKSAVSQVMVQNSSLVISSLTLNDSGVYRCKTINHERWFLLLVCPESGPPAVELFSEGDNIALSCRGWREDMFNEWLIRSNQTDGRLMSSFNVASDLRSRVDSSGPNGSFILYNVSPEDAGDYWCAVYRKLYNPRCASTTKILLKLREPPGFQLTVYIVRCWVLTGLLVILCVTVVAVMKKVGRREQRSAETDT